MNTTFLVIEGSYSNLQIALFKNKVCLRKISVDNLKASSSLILKIENILKKNKIKLTELDFIAINQGPGAFTSLRVVISTVNGISFATKIPLIGIDGLDALSEQTLMETSLKPTILICLQNAYNNEVYYSINKVINNKLKKTETKGYQKIDLLLSKVKQNLSNKKIMFVGNGTILHKHLIQKKIESNTIFPEKILSTPDVKQIAKKALEKWNKTQYKIYKLKPLYLKTQTFVTKK